jgi:hypothetical protein
MPCHRDMHACRIQKHAIVGSTLPYVLLMEVTRCLDIIAVTL